MKNLTEQSRNVETEMTSQDRHEQARRLSESCRKGVAPGGVDDFGRVCLVTGLNRKYAIGLLREPPEVRVRRRTARRCKNSEGAIEVLEAIWEAADIPWSVWLKAMIPFWLPHLT